MMVTETFFLLNNYPFAFIFLDENSEMRAKMDGSFILTSQDLLLIKDPAP